MLGPLDFEIYGRVLAQKMGLGLADPCSQVRMSAAMACRKLLQNVIDNSIPEDEQVKKEYFCILLPPLCLSRYYVADTKFMLYSQESWRILAGSDGPVLVSQYVEQIVCDSHSGSLCKKN